MRAAVAKRLNMSILMAFVRMENQTAPANPRVLQGQDSE
jgi:hypothetical protein